jgi:hypothetical protein
VIRYQPGIGTCSDLFAGASRAIIAITGPHDAVYAADGNNHCD